ncbi:MAG TPA: Tex family protein [Planctomycetaceae bacterium]|nr:Tex family protein [Planctomycetaceae bacterium]HQZ68308.1 Tex family protein [Planctomycetaceae bacterium]
MSDVQATEPVGFEFQLAEFCREVAAELKVSLAQIEGAVRLLEDGNTIPFIARYRKEATRGLDERQLRSIEDLLARARELAARKNTILKTIAEQGKLTPELRAQIEACTESRVLEDLYLPFKPKKRTRAAMARERGLQPLADLLLGQQRLTGNRRDAVKPFINPEKDVSDEESALRGACDIVAEVWAENAATRQWMLEQVQKGELVSTVRKGKAEEGAKFENYFDCHERISRMPAHRFLAMQRGEAEGVLRVGLAIDDETHQRQLKSRVIANPNFEFRTELESAADDCYKRLVRPAAESTLLQQLKTKADAEAIQVFAKNMRDLLMAAPAGPQVTIGIDPGFRTGCKVAVVDETGQFLTNETIYPTPPREDKQQAAATLLRLIKEHKATLISIGNGTASRETDRFVSDLIREHGLKLTKVVVNEAGASIYSASETAIEEYPDLDVTVRGAVSIAHRLQDPLSELVKIDPQSIGVGQYQHDVDQSLLKKALDREVESCVNSVGVDANTASPSLLSYVAGIGAVLAKKIVAFRNEHGAFRSRSELLKVPRFGQKAYQQAAGFLRIRDGIQPLDNSAVHPEQYPLVSKIAATLKTDVKSLIGSEQLVTQLSVADLVSADAGEFTVRDVIQELQRPGRDPRSEFKVATFSDSIQEITDLAPGMVVEGVITNVTKFGAFVDIGVHQDGLIHISQLADHFIRDPSEVVSVGDIVKVTVMEIDTARRRIALSRKAAK